MDKKPVIRVENLQLYFPEMHGFKRKYLRAVDDVSFSIYPGETVGLVGESGCGKSTLGRVVTGLLKNTSGHVYFHEKEIHKLKGLEKINYRKNVQMIFQDPAASLNPRLKVRQIIGESLLYNSGVDKRDIDKKVDEIMSVVGLPSDAGDKYPHEFSGGQQQRIGIARSLILNPEFIVCDEAVSALDVSVQAQVLNLLKKLKAEYNLTYLFISHNLSVVKHMCDRVVVMYLGKVVEIGTKEQIFNNPMHPYTKALLSAIPVADVKRKSDRIVLSGDLPSPTDILDGCVFCNRCYECGKDCSKIVPELIEVEKCHWVSCFRYK